MQLMMTTLQLKASSWVSFWPFNVPLLTLWSTNWPHPFLRTWLSDTLTRFPANAPPTPRQPQVLNLLWKITIRSANVVTLPVGKQHVDREDFRRKKIIIYDLPGWNVWNSSLSVFQNKVPNDVCGSVMASDGRRNKTETKQGEKFKSSRMETITRS